MDRQGEVLHFGVELGEHNIDHPDKILGTYTGHLQATVLDNALLTIRYTDGLDEEQELTNQCP